MVKIIIKIVLLILWALAAIGIYNSYKRIIYEYTVGISRWFVYLLVIAAAPVLVCNSLWVSIFDLFLPEGWLNGDDEFFDNEDEDNDNKS